MAQKPKNMIKTDYGNIDRDQYLKSTVHDAELTIRHFKKWLSLRNKALGTNFTLSDFDKD